MDWRAAHGGQVGLSRILNSIQTIRGLLTSYAGVTRVRALAGEGTEPVTTRLDAAAMTMAFSPMTATLHAATLHSPQFGHLPHPLLRRLLHHRLV